MLISSAANSAVLISGCSSASISTSISVVLSADLSLSKYSFHIASIFSLNTCNTFLFARKFFYEFPFFTEILDVIFLSVFEVSQSLVDSLLFKLVEYWELDYLAVFYLRKGSIQGGISDCSHCRTFHGRCRLRGTTWTALFTYFIVDGEKRKNSFHFQWEGLWIYQLLRHQWI